jgi:predicted nucleic acid-binding protein
MKQRLFIDINVLLDVLTNRQPHYAASAAVWDAVEKGWVQGFISANSVTTLYYLMRKHSGAALAMKGIRLVCDIFDIPAMDKSLIQQAIHASWSDFEDAVQHESALRAKATVIVTRDPRHFRQASIPVMSPEELLAIADWE